MAKKIKWTKDQIAINSLLDQGKKKEEIVEILNCGMSTVEKVITARHAGQKPPGSKPPGDEVTPAPKGAKVAEAATDEITEASILRLVPKVQSLSLTPDIFIGFMAAIARGFPGDIEDWLSLASRDFWLGRNRDFYAEVSGIQMKK